MAALVADTHSVIWYLGKSPRISQAASLRMSGVIGAGDPVYVPAICLVELTYLIEKGRLPLVVRERLVNHLQQADSGFELFALDLGVADALGRIPRDQVPDMPDRIIAATALHLGVPLVSRDRRIRAAGLDLLRCSTRSGLSTG